MITRVSALWSHSRKSILSRYAVAVLAVAMAIAVRLALTPMLGIDRVPYITLFAALLFVGWYSGLAPALIGVAIGALAASYFLLPPIYSFAVDDPHLVAGLMLYIVMGSVCAVMGSAVARTQHRAEKSEQLALAREAQLQRDFMDRERLAAIVASSDDAIIAMGLDAQITNWNTGAERLLGYPRKEAIGQPIRMLLPPDRFDEESRILDRIRQGLKVEHYETMRRRKDGSLVHVSLSVSPLRDADGNVVGASKIARDITQRKEHEEALERYREHLEDLVKQRTAEALNSQERLRHSERMASIGTLSAGLGHDIGNVLMPLDVHVRTVMKEVTPDRQSAQDVRESFAAIGRAVDYLRNLSNGLRMLARDPTQIGDPDAVTHLAEWWKEVRPLLNAMAQHQVAIHDDLPDDLPQVRLADHLLTQVIFNLVQNAIEALAGRAGARIAISARFSEGRLIFRVSDNGPGMPDDVKSRCLEPFFTTKTRGISSGLGLAIVNGIIQNARGTMHIDSVVGEGATFTFELPVTARLPETPISAAVTIADARLKAMVSRVLDTHRFEPRYVAAEEAPRSGSQLWVLDSEAVPEAQDKAMRFLNEEGEPKRRVLLLETAGYGKQRRQEGIIQIERAFRPTDLRQTLAHIAKELR